MEEIAAEYSPSLTDRFRGCLFGLAVGDAVGTTFEFCRPGTFHPIADMVGGGPFDLQAGQWTDDTSMALCLADSLLDCGTFDADDQMRRYVRWWKTGYRSCTDRCFDIGNTVRAALRRYETTGDPFSGSTDEHTAGNGSLMRLAPVPIFFFPDVEQAIVRAAESSRTTHGAPAAVDACRYFAGLLAGAFLGHSRDEILKPRFKPTGSWSAGSLVSEIEEVADGSYKQRQPPDIRGQGYVVKSLEAALWAFYHARDFRDGCLKAVNLGDDADTTGAIYGQIAGAYWGIDAIPAEWRDKTSLKDEILKLADELGKVAGSD